MIYSFLFLVPFGLAWLLPPASVHGGISICIFRTVVGRPCPLCGLTRAFVHAAHGRFDLAVGYHPFWYVVAAIMLALGILLAVDAITGTDTWGRLKRTIRPFWPAIVAIVAIYGVIRVIGG